MAVRDRNARERVLFPYLGASIVPQIYCAKVRGLSAATSIAFGTSQDRGLVPVASSTHDSSTAAEYRKKLAKCDSKVECWADFCRFHNYLT